MSYLLRTKGTKTGKYRNVLFKKNQLKAIKTVNCKPKSVSGLIKISLEAIKGVVFQECRTTTKRITLRAKHKNETLTNPAREWFRSH